MKNAELGRTSRRDRFGGGAALTAMAAFFMGMSSPARGLDYASRAEALDDLDRLASGCEARLRAVGAARPNAGVLVARFLSRLQAHRSIRDEVRRRLALAPYQGPGFLKPGASDQEIDARLQDLRQALDDLMIAYAESLPVFGEAEVVSRLAIDMVEVSKLRTVIDLWVVAEEG